MTRLMLAIVAGFAAHSALAQFELPSVPLPQLPPAPSLPSLPPAPTLPPLPQLPPAPNLPSLPPAPNLPPLPQLPPAPNLPSLPPSPSLPNLPQLPSIPNLPGVPSSPEKWAEQLQKVANGAMREADKVTQIQKDAIATATTTLQKAVKDVARNHEKAIKDIVATHSKAIEDGKNEIERADRDIKDAVQAIGGYADAKLKGALSAAERAVLRVREGKLVDAAWHSATDVWKVESDAAAQAAMRSTLLNTLGTVTASVYGGPAGASAYAAWLTYYQSNGDVNLAIKMGVIAGVTSAALAETGTIPTTDAAGEIVASEAAKKAAITGAVGGAAVAAAGGDEKAIRDAFIRGGAMVIIQEGYRDFTKHDLDGESLKASKGNPYCSSAVVDCQDIPRDAVKYEDGRFRGLDQSKLRNTAPHVGTNAPLDPGAPIPWHSEASQTMIVASKVPGMNAMAVLHDQWGLAWKMPPTVLVGTIPPAIVLTYYGTSAPLLEHVRVTGVSTAAKMTSAQLQHPARPVVTSDQTSQLPIRNEQVEVAFVCATEGDTRSVLVEVDETKKNFACRVVYRSNLERKVPWMAKNDSTYCQKHAVSLAKKQLDWGYACVVGQATPRKRPAS